MVAFTILSIFLLVACAQEATPPTLDYHWSVNVTVPEGAQPNQFIETGLGIVDLVSCEDGDTAEFLTEGQVIRLRFIGVDTPEASHLFEPWGAEATEYACEALINAQTIVLEWDEAVGTRRDQFGRFLGYVWVDGTLLNLRLIEQGWSSAMGVALLRYGTYMQAANDHAQTLGERIWGTHPTFSTQRRNQGDPTTLQALYENPEPSLLRRVTLEGVVTRILGDQAFMQEGDHGIFIYAGHGRPNPDLLQPGFRITLSDAQFFIDRYRFFGPFLTDVNNQGNPSKLGSIRVEESNVFVAPRVVGISELAQTPTHILVALENLEVMSYEVRLSSRVSPDEFLVLRDAQGNTVRLLQSDWVYAEMRTNLTDVPIGSFVNITAITAVDADGLLLLLTDPEDFVIIP